MRGEIFWAFGEYVFSKEWYFLSSPFRDGEDDCPRYLRLDYILRYFLLWEFTELKWGFHFPYFSRDPYDYSFLYLLEIKERWGESLGVFLEGDFFRSDFYSYMIPGELISDRLRLYWIDFLILWRRRSIYRVLWS